MKMKRLGTLPDCSDVLEVMIENGSGMTASIMTYGAVIKNLYVPGENGKADDVVLGQDTLENTEGIPPAVRPL